MRKRYPLAILAAALVMAVSRAWTCDDAFITFRAVEQFLAGHGPVFNIGERVQVFTHPLWFMALSAWAAAGGSLFPGAMWLSAGVYGCGLGFLYLGFRDKPVALAVVATAMIFSQSLMDFATGGLETPLSFALFAGGVWAIRSERRPVALAFLALLPLNRLDLLPWILPFAWIAAPRPTRGRGLALAAVCAPAAAWIAFSTLYYGAALPNTALAKLSSPILNRIDHGLAYVIASTVHDPGAMAILAMALAFGVRAAGRDRRLAAAAAASAAIGFAYAAWSGGDFMLGRFILPPLWAMLALILAAFPAGTGTPGWRSERRTAAVGLAFLAAAHLASGHSTTNLMLRLDNGSLLRALSFVGAADERRVFLPWFGAHAPARMRVVREAGVPATREPKRVGMLGQSGYLDRAEQVIVDTWALSDPFLGRFASLPYGRPGHPFRPLPDHYEKWRDPAYRFGDERLDALASDLRLAHVSPDLWSAERWRAIARLATYPAIEQDAFAVIDEGDSVRIEMKPWRLYRPGTASPVLLVWLRLHDAGLLRFRLPLPVALDRDCRPIAAPFERQDIDGIEVGARESFVLRCPKATLGRSALLFRIGAPVIDRAGNHLVEWDEALDAVRPRLWWINGIPTWLVQGWSEKPKPAVTVAIVLLLVAGGLWRSARAPRPV